MNDWDKNFSKSRQPGEQNRRAFVFAVLTFILFVCVVLVILFYLMVVNKEQTAVIALFLFSFNRIPGSDAIKSKVTDPETRHYVTIVHHSDETFNARDDRGVEIYDGKGSPEFLQIILQALKR